MKRSQKKRCDIQEVSVAAFPSSIRRKYSGVDISTRAHEVATALPPHTPFSPPIQSNHPVTRRVRLLEEVLQRLCKLQVVACSIHRLEITIK